jgi:acetyl/propionyl-CoA carboxylase alpha subunit
MAGRARRHVFAQRQPRRGVSESRPFRRVLIANRGEIAVRITRACRELGIEPVAVYSDADANALHLRGVDVAVRLGTASATDSYLRIDRIVEAALTTGCEAVHPGYGFLSEQAGLARACRDAGLAFVGPEPETLASLGDKLAARRAAAAAGVPVTPGSLDAVPLGDGRDDLATLRTAGTDVGFPLMVKAAAGGGGRGMRRVDDPSGLPDAVAAASREAGAAFHDATVYLERYVEGARHIEVQLLGDAQGTIVALGERDCSTQRRHQKLVEESPAPGLSTDRRSELHQMAVTVARTVGLRNAATVEFLYAPDGSPTFLEVNARLQVEHGVTELVTGLDLVHEQLWIAAGRPLGDHVLRAAERAAAPDRHAMEARISAEDPARDFSPVPGRLTRWRPPSGPGVRIDAGFEEGGLVSDAYDSLLAKLLVVAPDRGSAIARLRRALDEWETGGVQTTLPFHRWLLRHQPFLDARLRTDLVDRDWRPAPLREASASRAADAVAAWSASGPGGPDGSPGAETERSVSGSAGAARDDAWSRTARREAVEGWSR